MAKEKKKGVRLTSPLGTFVWPSLTRADTRFDKAGVYSLKLDLPASEEADAFVEKLAELHKEALAEAKSQVKPGKKMKVVDLPVEEKEDGGYIVGAFKAKASGQREDGTTWTFRPALFDADGQPLKGKNLPNIGGGTTGRVNVEVKSFYAAGIGAGISLKLMGVQIVDLVEYGGGNAESYGFGKVEGGYRADESASDDDDDADDEFSRTTDADEDDDDDEGDGDY